MSFKSDLDRYLTEPPEPRCGVCGTSGACDHEVPEHDCWACGHPGDGGWVPGPNGPAHVVCSSCDADAHPSPETLGRILDNLRTIDPAGHSQWAAGGPFGIIPAHAAEDHAAAWWTDGNAARTAEQAVAALYDVGGSPESPAAVWVLGTDSTMRKTWVGLDLGEALRTARGTPGLAVVVYAGRMWRFDECGIVTDDGAQPEGLGGICGACSKPSTGACASCRRAHAAGSGS